MIALIHRHKISFQNAFAGIIWAAKTQPNFRIHLFFSICAIVLGYILQISTIEMTVILFTIILGFSAEMINTSIEAMTDLITSEWRQKAKIAKDVSAGMMLVVAIGAICIAGWIFVPHIINIF